jgi:glycosyltransferase involved in cell wall biosynthesis
VDALTQIGGVSIALVGGPDCMAEALERQWIQSGQPEERFLYTGQVAPERVPLYLSAFDVCAMPFPWTEHFAYYASPIKLFEYMAARRAIVASNLPSTAEVLTDGESALLVPPSDVDALAAAITRLRDDPALRGKMAAKAYEIVMSHYTWEARVKTILGFIREPQLNALRMP